MTGHYHKTRLRIRGHFSLIDFRLLGEYPQNWASLVNEPLPDAQRAAARECLTRGRPHGDADSIVRTAATLGLAHTLRPRGRPRKTETKDENEK